MKPHIVALGQRGLDWLAGLEGGHRLKAYRDSGGVWTIGAGLIQLFAGRRVREGDVIDHDDAIWLFHNTLKTYESAVDAATRDDITQNEFDALVALCYNIGIQGFKTSTVLKRVNAKTTILLIAEAWSWWHYDDGVSVPGIVTRRALEVKGYRDDIYEDQSGNLFTEGAI